MRPHNIGVIKGICLGSSCLNKDLNRGMFHIGYGSSHVGGHWWSYLTSCII